VYTLTSSRGHPRRLYSGGDKCARGDVQWRPRSCRCVAETGGGHHSASDDCASYRRGPETATGDDQRLQQQRSAANGKHLMMLYDTEAVASNALTRLGARKSIRPIKIVTRCSSGCLFGARWRLFAYPTPLASKNPTVSCLNKTQKWYYLSGTAASVLKRDRWMCVFTICTCIHLLGLPRYEVNLRRRTSSLCVSALSEFLT